MNLAATFSILLCVVGATFSDQNAQSFRVATFNVNYDNAATEEIVDAIRSSKADIVCIQETSKRSYAVLKERLSEVYAHRETVGEFSFASGFELQELQYHESERCYSAVVTLGKRRIRIINTHLSPVIVPENPTLIGLLKALSENDERNRAEMASILEHINASLPTVIVGDFNSVSVSKAPGILRESGFVDSYATIHENADSNITWDWRKMRKLEPDFTKDKLKFADFARDLPIGLRVDYIFHTKQFRTISSEIIAGGGSDHRLVVSELKLDEPSHARAN